MDALILLSHGYLIFSWAWLASLDVSVVLSWLAIRKVFRLRLCQIALSRSKLLLEVQYMEDPY